MPMRAADCHCDTILLTFQEATFALKTNDPAGFNLIDVFAWYDTIHELL